MKRHVIVPPNHEGPALPLQTQAGSSQPLRLAPRATRLCLCEFANTCPV